MVFGWSGPSTLFFGYKAWVVRLHNFKKILEICLVARFAMLTRSRFESRWKILLYIAFQIFHARSEQVSAHFSGSMILSARGLKMNSILSLMLWFLKESIVLPQGLLNHTALLNGQVRNKC